MPNEAEFRAYHLLTLMGTHGKYEYNPAEFLQALKVSLEYLCIIVAQHNPCGAAQLSNRLGAQMPRHNASVCRESHDDWSACAVRVANQCATTPALCA